MAVPPRSSFDRAVQIGQLLVMCIAVAKLFFLIGQRDAELSSLTREVRAANEARAEEIRELKSTISDLGKITASIASSDGKQAAELAQVQRELAQIWIRLERGETRTQ